MAKITISTEDFSKAIKQINFFALKKKAEIKRELDRTAIAVESGAKRNLTRNGSRITGRLISSVVRQEFGEFNRTVGTNVEYAAMVEFGYRGPMVIKAHSVKGFTRNGSAVKPHTRGAHTRNVSRNGKPYLFPAAEAEKARFISNLKLILST